MTDDVPYHLEWWEGGGKREGEESEEGERGRGGRKGEERERGREKGLGGLKSCDPPQKRESSVH